MLAIPRALLDVFLIAFWSISIWSGGPRHDSYGYAVFARWQARRRLEAFLNGGTDGR